MATRCKVLGTRTLFALILVISCVLYLLLIHQIGDIFPSSISFPNDVNQLWGRDSDQEEANQITPQIGEQQSGQQSFLDPQFRHIETKANDLSQLNRTKIVGFITAPYKKVARQWYQRLDSLGYDNHYIIATDNETAAYFQENYPSYRMEYSELPPWPGRIARMKRYAVKIRNRVLMLFAHRWIYMLEELQKGHHILITDVDNIFNTFHPMSELELSEYDVFHALETRHPKDVFEKQGFVFCGGMGWFRSTPSVIGFVKLMTLQCGTLCDDQVLLNRIIANDLNMTWNRTEEDEERTVFTDDINETTRFENHFDRLVGLVSKSFTGASKVTGHKVKVWDRNFTYRGKTNPSDCPQNNWVSMPFVVANVRWQVADAKMRAFDIWDEHCPNEYSAKKQQSNLATKDVVVNEQNEASTNKKQVFINYADYPPTLANDKSQLNRTKIVGFITESYKYVAERWYDRLATLGYDNHYIIATDNETAHHFAATRPDQRVEYSELPPWPANIVGLRYGRKMRARIKMLFAHRWVYILQALQEGFHVLVTDVDNIFSKFHPMSELELSEYDVYHALETKHPEDVFEAQGFVFCGGMGWFRSSPQVIAFMEAMVRQCGQMCDDQVLLNQIIAFQLNVTWNRTHEDHQLRTEHNKDIEEKVFFDDHFNRIVGLTTKGFTGVSTRSGHKIKVWDRDFAYRGKNNPSDCPENNWVSMPFVVIVSRWEGPNAKLQSYDIWDEHCPNDFTRLVGNNTRTYGPIKMKKAKPKASNTTIDTMGKNSSSTSEQTE